MAAAEMKHEYKQRSFKIEDEYQDAKKQHHFAKEAPEHYRSRQYESEQFSSEQSEQSDEDPDYTQEDFRRWKYERSLPSKLRDIEIKQREADDAFLEYKRKHPYMG